MSVMMLGMGLGAMVMPSVAQRLVASFGWRLSYSIFGLAILVIPLPVVAAFLEERPENMGLLPDGSTEALAATAIAVGAAGVGIVAMCDEHFGLNRQEEQPDAGKGKGK